GGKSIRRLRAELSERHGVFFFSNPDQLARAISNALFPIQYTETPTPASPPATVAAPPPARARAAAPVAATAHEGPRASARKGYPKLWKPGDRLRVRFLDGTPKQRRFVERFVPIWSAYANIRFEFGDDPAAEIRVSFEQEGSWAYVGTDALKVAAGEPTANFGWVTDRTRDTEIDYTIIHEFGHVLGLLHEHQNPQAKIPWKKEAVYKTYEGWSRDAVNFNLFSKWDPKHFPYEKPFDRESIMAFPLPSDFTGKDFEMGQNMSLSPGDKEFIHRLYPFDEDGGGDVTTAAPSKRKPSKRRAGSR
ncbi:MAG TPA: M12 family metallopeptidase, partial [Pyrinomonadaceae bacterium]